MIRLGYAANWLTAGILVLCCSGCGPGFQAISWDGNPEEIVSIINDRPTALSDPPNIKVTPRDMPALAPGDVELQPMGNELSPQPKVVVRAYNLGVSTTSMPSKLMSSVQLADINSPPYKTGGRLEAHFPNKPSNEFSSCTAEFIGNEGVVLTAAHCVYSAEDGGWPDRLKFKLRYNDGNSAQTYDWQCMGIVRGWVAGLWPYDYAFIKVRGAPESGLGLKLNVGAENVDAIGYPSKYFGTRQMVHVTGTKNTSNPSQMFPNDMGPGASGGAWIDSNGNAVSLNSFYYRDDPGKSYGPVFTAATLSVHDHVSRGCTDNAKALGANITGNPFGAHMVSKASSVLSDVYAPLNSGSHVDVVNSPACGCTGRALMLRNDTTESRIVAYRTTLTVGGKTIESETRRLLASRARVGLGCPIYDVGQRSTCSAARSVRLVYDRRASAVSSTAFPAKSTSALLAFNQLRTKSDLQACVAACTGSTTKQCLELGKTAVAALAPLSKFLSTTTGNGPDGVVVRKEEIVSGFGGDPASAKDPCDRGDLRRESGLIVNHGRGCSLRTDQILPTSYKFLTNLMMRPTIRAAPSPDPGQTTAYFNDQAVAPGIEFIGARAAAYNRRYGGDIYGVAQSGTNSLVLATANSCIRGAYRAR